MLLEGWQWQHRSCVHNTSTLFGLIKRHRDFGFSGWYHLWFGLVDRQGLNDVNTQGSLARFDGPGRAANVLLAYPRNKVVGNLEGRCANASGHWSLRCDIESSAHCGWHQFVKNWEWVDGKPRKYLLLSHLHLCFNIQGGRENIVSNNRTPRFV